MNWPRPLSLFLWIAPHVLLGVLAVVLCKRQLYRAFPFFFAYVIYETAEFVLLFGLRSIIPGVTAQRYAYAYYATLAVSIVLRFGVIEEISGDLLRESRVLKVVARRSLRGVQTLLLVAGILLAIYAPGDRSVQFAAVSVVNRGAAMVQSGLLLSLLLLSRFLGLSWRRMAFGVALGLGVLSSVDVAAHAIRTQFTALWVPYLNLLITGAYFVCVSIWITYVLAPEPKPVALTVIPNNQVEIWNREFQQLLRR